MPHGRQSTWSPDDDRRLKDLWNEHGGNEEAIGTIMGRTVGQIEGRSIRLNLQYGKKAARNYNPNNAAVRQMRTQFPKRVEIPAWQRDFILKPGWYQRKLGDRVKKGRWRGMRVYSLTLEERKTCPNDCPVLAVCYGNNMSRAVRYKHGRALEFRLIKELAWLEKWNHRRGFVVRLHILGDFYSVEYVDFWRRMLDLFPSLHVFGYSAWQTHTPIGAAVAALRDARWDRFAVRTSGQPGVLNTIVIDHHDDKQDAIVCPVETGRTRSCSTCGLCWTTQKTIAFVRH